jgi:hypothetical protein
MDLVLTVQRADDPHGRAVFVEVDADTDGRELVDALAQHVGLGAGAWDAWSLRTRLRIDPQRPVRDAELLDGDTVVLAYPDGAPAWAQRDATVYHHVFELLVVGGPRAGHRFALVPGEHYTARLASCVIPI